MMSILTQNQILKRFLVPLMGVLLLSVSTKLHAKNHPSIISTSIYQDDTKKLTLSQIQKIDSIGLFEKIEPAQNLGLSSDVTWVKVVVENPSNINHELFLRWKEPLTHYVHFYEVGTDTFRESISGLSIDDARKEVKSNAICFPIELKALSTNIYFLQISSPYNKEMNISLVNRRQLSQDERSFNLFAGAIFCSLFIISLYNLFLGIALKDRLYFHFVAVNLIDTVASTTMLGLMPVVFPFIPFNRSPFTTTLITGLFGIMSANFIIQFLRLKQNDRLWYWVMMALIIAEFIAIIQGSVSYYVFEGTYILIPVINLLFITFAFITVIVAYLKGNNDARFLLIAWLILWFGLMTKLLTIVGLISSSWFSDYFVYTSGVIESILLSFALADRYNRLQKEKLRLEINLQTKDKDLNMLATNNKVRYNERKKFLSDLQELAKSNSDSLSNKLMSFILNLKQNINREKEFIYKADNIHILNAEFEQKLKSAYPFLSKTDLELCGYIKLNLSLKEVADIRHTSEAAIKMARYRLKEKLQLQDQKLDDYIQSNF